MIRKVDMSDVPGRKVSWNALVEADIRDFVESGWPVGEIDTSKYKTVQSARQSYKKAVQRMRLADKLALIARSGRLFVIRGEERP